MKVIVSIKDRIAHVLFDSPPLNILTNEIKSEIKKVFQTLATNKEVSVIYFEAAGKHFCCGANLKEFPDRIKNNEGKKAWIEGHEMLQAIMNTPQPTIVSVQGNALGGGAELASAFDIRLFGHDVVFSYPEVSRSVYPGNGGFERFIQLCGKANASYLFLTGEKMTASDMLRIGMANKVVERNQLETEGWKVAELLASYAYTTIKTIKLVINHYKDSEQFYQQGMDYFSFLHQTEDIQESINAFFEKRVPLYQHNPKD
jgi:enoyl-CoA hydratase/carnithine racemase